MPYTDRGVPCAPASTVPPPILRRLPSRHGHRTAAAPAARGIPRRDRAARRGPHGRRRPLPGHRRGTALRRAAAARAAPARQRGAGRAPARRDHPRATDQDERKRMSDMRQRIQDVIDNEPVALFMKGTPQFVMCGNSDRALRALRGAAAPVTAVDVLPDPAIRQELSTLSGWPTIPQVFVKGELIGGADIVEELEQTGELEQKLGEALGAEYRNGRAEKTIAVS